jgi:general secretion pathway protein A
MYIQYFGLKENPFALPPDPRYLYLSRRHQEALAHLRYGINEGGGFVQLTGEVGTGKTMMIRALLERLPEKVDVALVLYPFLSVREFLASILDDLRIGRPAESSLKGMIDALNAFLLENHAKGRRTVLIVDEAHKLSRELLEQIRLLTNLETTKEKLLQIVLVGQPELAAMLASRELRQLAQRVTARYNLNALQPAETGEYILHRLRVAGAQMPLFTRAALRSVHRWSGGIPRLINLTSDRALLGAYARGKARVSVLMVRHAAQELEHGVQPGASRRLIWAGAATLSVAVLAAGALWLAPSTLRTAPTEVAAVESTTTGATETGESDGPQTSAASAAAPEAVPAAPTLAAVLADPAVATDTDSAFAGLFNHWRLDYASFAGATGCERALKAGLHCLFEAGTWGNLRQLNRPAIIELVDQAGTRHHVVVTALGEEKVQLELSGQRHEFALADVGRSWYGKYLVLWKPPFVAERVLRRGAQDPALLWVREALASYGLPSPATAHADRFDAELDQQVREFQRRHQLADDGLIGKTTLLYLSAYAGGDMPKLVAAASETVTR